MNGEPMTCERFGAWLDAGCPADAAGAAAAHAGVCARCGAALAAEREIESLLAAPSSAAPQGFTGRVMHAALNASAARASARPFGANDAMPWWARAAMQPSTLGAAALAALIAWRPAAFEQAGRTGLAAALAAWQGALAEAIRLLGPAGEVMVASPAVQLGVLASAALLFGLAALPLYRLSERVALHGTG